MAVLESVVSSWKTANVVKGAAGAEMVACRLVTLARTTSAGALVTSADAAVATDVLTLQLNAVADPGVVYTGQTTPGLIDIGDGNADSVQELVNVINGVGVGSTKYRGWFAEYGDMLPGHALATAALAALSAANTLLGNKSAGLSILGATPTLKVHAAVGAGDCRKGSTWMFPDLREDIPGSSTVGGVNTPVRATALGSEYAERTVTARKKFRINSVSVGFVFVTTKVMSIFDMDGNLLYKRTLTAAAANELDERDFGGPLEFEVHGPLYFEFDGTGVFTDGSLSIGAEENLL